MKKVILIFLPLLLLCTGFTSKVDVEIDSDNINETISLANELLIDFEDSSDYTTLTKNFKLNYDNDNSLIILNRTISSDDMCSIFDNVPIANCSITEYDKEITLTLTDITMFNRYPDLTSVNLAITINGTITDSDADSVVDNVATWTITKKDVKDSTINISYISKKKVDNSSSNTIDKLIQSLYDSASLGIICVIILVVGLVIYVFVKLKEKNSNKI